MTTQTANAENPTVTKIREVMERKGWNQTQMADYLGVPRGTLGNWLQGTREPMPVVSRLLDVLNTIEWAAPTLYQSFLPGTDK